MLYCMGCMEQYTDNLTVCPHCGYVRGTSAREAYHMPPENILRGRYIVGRVLGYGGFGVTYIGYDAQLERKVAIKEYLPSALATRMPGNNAITVYGGESTEQFNDGLDKFVNEAQRLAKFNGLPGIVSIYDSFSENGTAYIVMEYLQGSDVKGLLNANGPLPYNQALQIILSVAETLEQVHAHGIIHRDIAPDNILITEEGEVKLLDFGAARYESAANSKSLSVILKSGYAPEEQYRSHGEQGPWTDVYALAATFYKMLTGTTPEDSMERSVKDDLKEPSKLGADLPQAAENALMNALNIRAADRTRTMNEFAASLGREEVTRTKVKPRKQQSGNFPLWLKITLGGAIAAAMIFAILSATGTVNLSGVPEGMVNAPGLLNRQESEAERIIRRAGLKYTIAGKDFNEKVDEGKIIKQEPLPGTLLALGETIRLWVSAGSAKNLSAGDVLTGGKIDPSKIPNLELFTYAQAMDILGRLDIPAYANVQYNGELEAGLVISYSLNEEGQHVSLEISAGTPPDEAEEVQPPLLLGYAAKYIDGKGVSGNYAFVPSNDPRVRETQIGFYDEESYENFRHGTGLGWHESWDEHLPLFRWDVSEMIINELNQDARNDNINYDDYNLRMVLRYMGANHSILSETISPVNLRISFPAAEPKITGFMMASDLYEDEWGHTRADYIIIGDFKKDSRYAVRFEGGAVYHNTEIVCENDGLLDVKQCYIHMDEVQAAQPEYLPQRVFVMECISFNIDNERGEGLVEYSRMGFYGPSLIDESALPQIVGMSYEDAVNALEPLRRQQRMDIFYEAEHSASVPAGTVLRQEFDAFYGRLTVILSAGAEPAPGSIPMPLWLPLVVEYIPWEDKYNESMRVLIPKSDGYYVQFYYQTDNGPKYEGWHSSYSWYSDAEKPQVGNVYIYNQWSEAFWDKSWWHEEMGERPYGGQGLVYFTMSIHKHEDFQQWPTFDEIPDSQKIKLDTPVRLSVSRGSIINGAKFTRKESYEDEYNPDRIAHRFYYEIDGNFDYRYYSQIRRHALDENGMEVYGIYDDYDYNNEILTYSLVMDEYQEEYNRPVSFLVYRHEEASIGADGVIHVRVSYDLVDIEY